MTKVRYVDKKNCQELVLNGHADDKIVCAGISAISQTLIANLMREEAADNIRMDYKMETPGEMEIIAWLTDESRETIRMMFHFTMEGLRRICEDYPGHIEFVKEEKNNGSV